MGKPEKLESGRAKTSSKDFERGRDQAYYESEGGVAFSSAFMANGITGTPPDVSMRGGAAGRESTLDSKNPFIGNNGIPGRFFGKSGR